MTTVVEQSLSFVEYGIFRLKNNVPFFAHTYIADARSQSSSVSSFWSLRLQMCPARVDLDLSTGLLKFALCPPYLSLKVLAVRPTYFSSVLLTVALYTRLLIVHLPGRGHLDLSWQLQAGGGLGFSWFKILKLCFAICVLRFGKHL